MSMNTTTADLLIRDEVWSDQLKTVLQDELMGMNYVDWLGDFVGDTLTLPSIGEFSVDDYTEDTDVKLRPVDTGEFQLQVTEYKSSGIYFTDKVKADSFYFDKLQAAVVPGQHRAIMQDLEEDIMGLSAQQTAGAANNINGVAHRFVASGTGETMTPEDFAIARYALKKANVPDTNLVAIVDPSVELTLNKTANLTNLSNNPRWEGIVSSGIATGMKFIANIYGFDVYTSNYLADANETIGGSTTAAGKANMFFSAASDVLPFIGQMKQAPQVEGFRNAKRQRDEHFTTARWGVDLYRPENLVVCLSDTDAV